MDAKPNVILGVYLCHPFAFSQNKSWMQMNNRFKCDDKETK